MPKVPTIHFQECIVISIYYSISVTSRPIRPGEVEAKDYFFVSRDKMEEDIEANKFIEFGEYKGNLYGTSTESVKAIINSGHVCILNPHYQALKILRNPDLKPYIIYIKPPSLEELKETRNAVHARSTFDVNNSRGFTVIFLFFLNLSPWGSHFIMRMFIF